MPSFRRSRRRLAVVCVVAVAGAVCFRSAFVTMRTLGWAAWPLALLLCLLAGAAWHLAVILLRPSRASRTHTESTHTASADVSSDSDIATPP